MATAIKLPEIKITVTFDKNVRKSDLPTITSSYEAYDVLRKIFNADTFDWTEEMILLCLNKADKVIGFYKISSGGFAGTVCDPKVVLTTALNGCASQIIIAHNHPSGNLKPSQADLNLTRKIKEVCQFLDMPLLDHIIISSEGYTSLADEGLI